MARDKQLHLLLSRWVLVLIVFFGSIPVFWQVGTTYEGELFPVVEPLRNDNGKQLPILMMEMPGSPDDYIPYVDIYVQFNKVRQCEFLLDERNPEDDSIASLLQSSLAWYTSTGSKLKIVFDEDSLTQPETQPTGKRVAGPWRIYGVRSVEDTYAIIAHKCHPLWTTYTKFYP